MSVSKKPYIILNIIFIALISSVFLYCLFYNSLEQHINCIHREFLGIECPSCGLTRSFSSLLHGNIESASASNKYGVWIFLFLLIQISLRLTFMSCAIFNSAGIKSAIRIDWIASTILFMICFSPFIFSTFYIFYAMWGTGNQ
jgi:hypothetical protein